MQMRTEAGETAGGRVKAGGEGGGQRLMYDDYLGRLLLPSSFKKRTE